MKSERLSDADDLAETSPDMLGGVRGETLDFDLDGQGAVIGLGEDARRHQAALGQKFERARQDTRLGVGFETISDGGIATLESEDAKGRRGHRTIPWMTSERTQRRGAFQGQPGC